MFANEYRVKMKKFSGTLFILIVNIIISWTCASVYKINNKCPGTVTNKLFQNHSETELTNITLQSCGIKAIHIESFINMPNLTYLRIDYNDIDQLIPGTFRENIKLKDIHLCCNHLSALKNGIFENLESAVNLSLHRNTIKSIEANVFTDMQSLKILLLWGNLIATLTPDIFRMNKSLLKLSLSQNSIKNLNKSIFMPLYNLQKLILQGNRITKINKELFSNLTRLEVLYLSSNVIQELEVGTFTHNTKLRELWSSDNEISRLDDNLFINLSELEILSVRNNNISHIGKNALPNITAPTLRVNLEGNKLQYLHRSIINSLNRAAMVTVDSNPWFCDCHLKQLHDVWKKHASKYNIPQCAGPTKLQSIAWNTISSEDFCPKPSNIFNKTSQVTVEENICLHNGSSPRDGPINSTVNVVTGEFVSFTCRLCGQQVLWLYRNNIIHADSRSASDQPYTILTKVDGGMITTTLAISNLRMEDGGVYTCQVVSSYMMDRRSFTLKINTPETDAVNFWQIIAVVLIVFVILMILVIVVVITKYACAKGPEVYDLPLRTVETDQIQTDTPDYDEIDPNNHRKSTDGDGYLRPDFLNA